MKDNIYMYIYIYIRLFKLYTLTAASGRREAFICGRMVSKGARRPPGLNEKPKMQSRITSWLESRSLGIS